MVVNFDTTFYRSGINLFIRIIPLARAGPQFMTKVESGSDSGLSTPQEALESIFCFGLLQVVAARSPPLGYSSTVYYVLHATIQNVPVAYSPMVPGSILGPTARALFLSIKYRKFYPRYIHHRTAGLRDGVTRSIPLVQVRC